MKLQFQKEINSEKRIVDLKIDLDLDSWHFGLFL